MVRSSTPATVGVEEEFLLVDAGSRLPVPRAGQVLAAAGPVRATLKPELQRSQVEAASGVCRTLAELRGELVEARGSLAAAARAGGTLLVSVGHPVLLGEPPGAFPGTRFAKIMTVYPELLRQYQTCGCHVHVGVADRDLAVRAIAHLRPWLPTLLALSGNSPLDRGSDTGHDSWRTVLQDRFPGAGTPPACDSAKEWDAALDRLVDTGVLVDRQQSFWLARPSEHLPTIEFRVADGSTVDDSIMQAGLTRALVSTALTAVHSGYPAPTLPSQVAAAAVRAAARDGLRGPAVDPVDGGTVPAAELVHRLLEYVDAALHASGDRDEVHRLVAQVLRTGNGADRQRRSGHGPHALVDWLAGATVRNPPVSP